MFWRRCGASAYSSSSVDWKRKAATDAQTLNEYAELFGSDQAAAAETSEAAATQEAVGNRTAGVPSGESLDIMRDNAMLTDAHIDQNSAAISEKPATKKQKKSKVTAAPAENQMPAESQAPAKKGKKGKRGKQDIVVATVLGLDSSNAPWAHEPVPASIDAEGMGQLDPSKGAKLTKPKKKEKSKHSNKSTKKDQEGADGPVNADKALALLGFPQTKS